MSTFGSTVGSRSSRGTSAVNACRALTRRRRRFGSTCSSLASARSDVSSIPPIAPPAADWQADRDRDRLVVVEQERRQDGTRFESIAADGAAGAMHRIAEGAQALDVVADGPRAHLEAVSELGPTPVTWCLEEREQPQQTGRGIHLVTNVNNVLGTKSS